MVPGQPVRCMCGGAFVAPYGVPSVVCPYCRQPVMVAPMQVAIAAPVPMQVTEARRSWTMGLIAVAIVATLAGAFTRAWLKMGDGEEEARMGLLGYEECRHGRCETGDYSDEHDSIARVMGTVGYLAFAGTLALVGVLGWTGARVISRRPAVGPSITGIVIASLALLGATAWTFTLKTALHERLDFGWSYLVYVVGAACGLVACAMATKTR